MKTSLTLVVFSIFSFTNFAFAQTDSTGRFQADVGCDVMSRYVWRGMDYGHSPALQPWITLSNGPFTLGGWSSYTVNDSRIQEVDLYLDFNIGEMFTFSVWDYFSPCDTVINNKYFYYDQTQTGHTFESILKYNGTENFPIYLLAGYNFYGADSDKSLYFETGYSFTLSDNEISVFAGCSPYSGIYGEDFSVNNMGINITKNLKITELFSVPLNASVIINPENENIFLVAGFSF